MPDHCDQFGLAMIRQVWHIIYDIKTLPFLSKPWPYMHSHYGFWWKGNLRGMYSLDMETLDFATPPDTSWGRRQFSLYMEHPTYRFRNSLRLIETILIRKAADLFWESESTIVSLTSHKTILSFLRNISVWSDCFYMSSRIKPHNLLLLLFCTSFVRNYPFFILPINIFVCAKIRESMFNPITHSGGFVCSPTRCKQV